MYLLCSKLNRHVFIILGSSSSYEQAAKDEMRLVEKYRDFVGITLD